MRCWAVKHIREQFAGSKDIMSFINPQIAVLLLVTIALLISNLLLGKSKPFPVPLGAWKPETGVFQHAIAGTSFSHDYPQGKPRRKWWRLWR